MPKADNQATRDETVTAEVSRLEWLNLRAKRAGLSQVAIATALGYSTRHIGRILNGEIDVPSTLEKIQEVIRQEEAKQAKAKAARLRRELAKLERAA